MSHILKKARILLIVSFTFLACDKDDSLTPVIEIIDEPTMDPQIVAEFKPNLSEINIYTGVLNELNVSANAFEYGLSTPLFTDYSQKQRIIALPENTKIQSNGDGLPTFPDNTVIAKTFYYNLDERDLSLGKHIIETRLLIKINGIWETGNYKWNEDQTDAILDLTGSPVPVSWIDINGITNTTNYNIPSDTQCFTCHRTGDIKRPIGVKLRTLNFDFNGTNQIEYLIDNNLIEGLESSQDIRTLPKWDDAVNYTREERARAYLDVNCAHCHSDGGYCDVQSPLRLNYETSFTDSNIQPQKNSIIFRVSSDFQPGLTMPWIGTSMLHEEGVDLIMDYVNSIF